MHHYFLQIKCSLQVKSLLLSVDRRQTGSQCAALLPFLVVVVTGEALPGDEAGLYF